VDGTTDEAEDSCDLKRSTSSKAFCSPRIEEGTEEAASLGKTIAGAGYLSCV
jgi:hypothetical protein